MNMPEPRNNPLMEYRVASNYLFIDHFVNMVNSCRKHANRYICKQKLFNHIRLKTCYQQYHPISMTEGGLPDGMYHLQDGIDPSHHGSTSVSAPESPLIRKSTNNLPIDNVPRVPPPEDTPKEETIGHQKPDLTCTPDSTKMKAHRQVVGVENTGGKTYSKTTGLYNTNCKY